MTYEEAIETLKVAKAEVEWNYPLDYHIALDMAIEALEEKEKYQEFFRDLFSEEPDATYKVIKESDTK